ncbi:hypothetical protein BAUCODRAFT_148958 [Baudoinia panamericana UAMH 10762]|uniref:Phosphoribulokinase/uridine kinase domain-containing protein n=1 Tax=Baudoinia panamericana (strain UAMH 10762) TaxID=717646 RepID=M2LKU6_BAUPA|nr:uncharacterized protein BAUCODRAFT_148958 [Baudoinia panamericana UAMH 10762]EMC94907.1 hypothetical protein BAUCODRAFT_148958 [Baudoinia panamericana UAMH 10762]
MAEPNNVLLVGMSGPSSSGKTTLARLIRDVFPNVFLLHEDDFYKPEAELPKHPSGVLDWDALESINMPKLQHALQYIREHGMPPPDFESYQDRNSIGPVDVDHGVIEDLKWRGGKWMFQDVPPIAIIDGFLLYSDSMRSVREMFDVKIFLRTDLKTARARREARSGYATLEGFWEDPPGYVDNVVWPNYVKEHDFLFQDKNVEGEYDEAVLKRLDIRAPSAEAQSNMTACLKWAYDVVEEALEKRVAR